MMNEVNLIDANGEPLLVYGQPVTEGFVRDFFTNQIKKLLLSKLDDIKNAFLKGDFESMKVVTDWIIEQAKSKLGITLTESQIASVLEFALAMVTAKSDLPKALKEGGELLVGVSSFLSAKPLYAVIVKQVGELLIAVAKELGNKSLLLGASSSPDDHLASALEDFEATFATVGAAKPDVEFGIIEIITIGRVLWELAAWWKRRREQKSNPQT